VVAGVGIAGLLVAGSFPWKALSSDQRAVAQASAQLAALERANAGLSAQAVALRRPSTVERLAREELGLVPRGWRAYAILPSTPASSRQPGGTHGASH
jgi:cell division protein FtsB